MHILASWIINLPVQMFSPHATQTLELVSIIPAHTPKKTAPNCQPSLIPLSIGNCVQSRSHYEHLQHATLNRQVLSDLPSLLPFANTLQQEEMACQRFHCTHLFIRCIHYRCNIGDQKTNKKCKSDVRNEDCFLKDKNTPRSFAELSSCTLYTAP